MSPSPGSLAWLHVHARTFGLTGILAAAVLLAWALLTADGTPGAGWLIGLAFWLAVALGAFALLAIQALTGGDWGRTLRPALVPAMASLPLFLPLTVPLLLAMARIYPWVGDPGLAVHPDVARLYLNPGGFVLRTVLVLLGWSAFAWLLLRTRHRVVVGAFALVFHLVASTPLAVDWLLSIDPRFTSTAAGLAAISIELLAVLAWVAILRPEPAGSEHGRAEDLAMLLFSAAAGAAYLSFAQFLVAWYGNLPAKAAWFQLRWGWDWRIVQAVSLIAATILPLALLLVARIRERPRALGLLGLVVLVGVLAHVAWVVGPAFGPLVLPAGLLGTAAVGGVWIGLAYGPIAAWLATREARHAA